MFSLQQIKENTMKNIFAILIVLVLTTSNAFATNDNTETPVATTTITGQVLDKITGEALAGVKIILDENDSEVYTDFDGNFTISEISTGTHSIKADLISYQSQQQNIEVTSVTSNLKVEIEIDNN